MKIFNNYFLMLVASCCLFAACGDDDDYKAGAPADGQGVFFSNTLSSKISLSSQATSFEVEISRSVIGSAATVNLTSETASDKFTIPTSVDFAADATTAKISISYNPASMEYDDYAQITLSVAGTADTTPYGLPVYTFTAGIPAPYKSLGMAIFSDAYLFEKTYKVELQQNEEDPTQYRLVDPYSAGLKAEKLSTEGNQSEYLTFKLLSPGDKLNGVAITEKGLVHFNDCCTGAYNTTYSADINIYHPAKFTKMATEEYWLFNHVIHYKEDGTPGAIQLAPYYYMTGVGGWNYTQADGLITIIFPGYVIADYSVAVAYTGRRISPEDISYFTADVTLGEDVELAKVAVVEGEDWEAAVEKIKDGTLAAVEVTESGSVSLEHEYDATKTYSIVVVSYAKDNAKENAHVTFPVAEVE